MVSTNNCLPYFSQPPLCNFENTILSLCTLHCNHEMWENTRLYSWFTPPLSLLVSLSLHFFSMLKHVFSYFRPFEKQNFWLHTYKMCRKRLARGSQFFLPEREIGREAKEEGEREKWFFKCTSMHIRWVLTTLGAWVYKWA